MDLKDVKVPPHNYTLMGVIEAVAGYYELSLSRAALYGASGQAFMIHVHDELCPSGPYCWKRKPFYKLLANLGIIMTDLGFISEKNPAEDRTAVEATMRDHLKSANPCGLINLEYQLIAATDDTGFITSQPWYPHNKKHPPAHLTFGTWDEFGKSVHVNFFTFTKGDLVETPGLIRQGLAYALDVQANPGEHANTGYTAGPGAYDAWITAIKAGHGKSHGNWWNAVVWGECRTMASAWMKEIAAHVPKTAEAANELADDYVFIADSLNAASDKEMEDEPKIELLSKARDREIKALGALQELQSTIPHGA